MRIRTIVGTQDAEEQRARPDGAEAASSAETISSHDRAAGVRNASDAEYRAQQFAWLDRWVVETWSDDEGTTRFVPRPLWDGEAVLTRTSFDTREEAEGYVSSLGGRMVTRKGVDHG